MNTNVSLIPSWSPVNCTVQEKVAWDLLGKNLCDITQRLRGRMV